jgi:hypothetical protein
MILQIRKDTHGHKNKGGSLFIRQFFNRYEFPIFEMFLRVWPSALSRRCGVPYDAISRKSGHSRSFSQFLHIFASHFAMHFGTVPDQALPAGFTAETRIGRKEADQDPISGSSAWSLDLVYHIPYLFLED